VPHAEAVAQQLVQVLPEVLANHLLSLTCHDRDGNPPGSPPAQVDKADVRRVGSSR
jgi:hypothetical protein